MEKNDCRRFSLRLNYDNSDHLRIMDTLDDLNLEVHKSKNQFVVNALIHYMDFLKNDTLTCTAERQRKEREKSYVTKEYVDSLVKDMSEALKSKLYEDLMRFLVGAMVSSGMGKAYPVETVENFTQDGSGMDNSDSVKPDDLTETLGQYDSVLSQVMSWSEE